MTSAEWDSGPVLTAQELLVQATTGTPPPSIHIFTTSGGNAVIRFTDADGVQYDIEAPTDTLEISKVGTDTPQLHFTDDLASVEEGIWLHSQDTSTEVAFRETDGFLYKATNFVFEDWKTITLPALWTADQPCQYKLFPDGMVRLRGIARGNVSPIPAGTTVVTLPAGYRPHQNGYAVAIFDAAAAHGRILYLTTGVVQVYEAPNNVLNLDTIQFSVI
jgi:hypothetical protein